ncbi:hypothetical protein BD626DRAFT_566235 [Schizophyllum amplum]|uniref:F-box domain-containing protein n=1 Tax=Schizophyllum amplum TaxID=97359 RepID=A0A550CQY2_9AGAR|nr:hypothetical protein BD626DRAFT_566235 [Auriculariopsis ampla]
MARRSKPKRARYAYISSQPRSAPAYRDLLSLEMWHLVFSYCPPSALLAARDTCRLFRDAIDRNEGELLARAPLLLPIPPPDPIVFMSSIKHRDKYRAMRTYLNIKDTGGFGSATYTKLLFGPGRCYVCNEPTDRLPERILDKVYLCSRKCKQRLFHSQVIHLLPRHKYLPASPLSFDRYLIPWLPTIVSSKPHRTRSVLTRDIMAARKEYREIVNAPFEPQERARRMEALFAKYVDRYHRTKVFAAFQLGIDEWREQMRWESKDICDANTRRLAPKRGRHVKTILQNHVVQRALRLHTRDLRLVKPRSLLRRAGVLKPKVQRTVCTQCDASISADYLDWHILRRHPNQLPLSRLNVETGSTEYRCEICEASSLQWFSEVSLSAHQYHKHGICKISSTFRDLLSHQVQS